MNKNNITDQTWSGNLSRRKFISSCAACGACLAISPYALSSGLTFAIDKKMKIKILYSLHVPVQDRPDWPNVGFDFNPAMNNVRQVLIKEFPSFEFLPAMATGKEEAEKIILEDKDQNIDGYIVYQLNCWNQVVQTIAKTNKPVLYIDFEYGGSGGFLVYNAQFLRNNQSNLGFVSSSKMEDIVAAVKGFKVIAKGGTPEEFAEEVTHCRLKRTPGKGNMTCKPDPMKTIPVEECRRRLNESRILAVRDENALIAEPIMGIPLEYISFAEVNAAWEAADKDEARTIAEKWTKNAAGVIDVPFKELQNSASMYLGMKSVLEKHRASAITMNCLGGFYGNHIHAYPCLGFHELNNEALVGGCECDVRSAATMLAFNILTNGRSGFISDPVIDTSKRQIIYAHCVAPSKMFGPEGATNPFTIMTHSEDRQGAAVRSILPLGYMTTTLMINETRKEILLHQAKAVANDPDDRACRTKLCAEPLGDIEKLFREWDQWGWHRVTFYGDFKSQVYEFADSLGWKVLEEA